MSSRDAVRAGSRASKGEHDVDIGGQHTSASQLDRGRFADDPPIMAAAASALSWARRIESETWLGLTPMLAGEAVRFFSALRTGPRSR